MLMHLYYILDVFNQEYTLPLFAIRAINSGKFVYFNESTEGVEYIFRDLNYSPYRIGYLAVCPEIHKDTVARVIKCIEEEYITKLEFVKIQITRTEYDKSEVYTDSFPPIPKDEFAKDWYEVI